MTGVTKVTSHAVVFAVACAGLAATPASAAGATRPSITDVRVSTEKAYIGDRVALGVVIANRTARTTAATSVAFFLSKDGYLRGATLVRRGTLPSLAPGRSRVIGFGTTIPSSIPSAKYRVVACRSVSGTYSCGLDKAELRVSRRSATLSISPGKTTDFGSIVDGASSASKQFVVRNTGQKSSGSVYLEIDGDDDDHFRITGTSCTDRNLGPGDGCTAYVAFRPRDDGKFEAELTADPDEGNEGSVKLRGIGRGDDENDGSDESSGDDAPSPCGTGSSAAVTNVPASVLNLTNWKVTLPVDGCDDGPWADEVTQPQLASFQDPSSFLVNSTRTGVVFRSRVDGARTSSNTKYPRSELREMSNRGEDRASWSNKAAADGTHTMTMEAAITATPTMKPEVVAAQIHDASDDVIMIRLYGKRLVMDAEDSHVQMLLDENYVLGTRFTLTITASAGRIRVVYNGSRVVNYQRSGTGYYFKAGCYTLSNTSFDSRGQFGEVVIFKLGVTHT